jgi:hypothetical protein
LFSKLTNTIQQKFISVENNALFTSESCQSEVAAAAGNNQLYLDYLEASSPNELMELAPQIRMHHVGINQSHKTRPDTLVLSR